jgi:hypothetical protein
MLELTVALMKQVLEPITFVVAYGTALCCGAVAGM